jgi:hypothetical protein
MQPAKSYISKIIETVLLVLFVSHYGGITLFYHAHQVGEKTISHSHPYRKDAPQNHNHTTKGYFVVQCINEASFNPSSPLLLPEPACDQKVIAWTDGVPRNINSVRIEGSLLRAPPSV